MTPRRRVPRLLAGTPAAALAVVLGLTACGPSPVEPDDVDAQRLAAVDAEDPYTALAAAVDAERHADPARAAPKSTYSVAFRAAVSTSLPLAGLAAQDGEEPAPAAPDRALVAPAARALVDTVTAAGWTVTLVACEPNGDGETLDLAGVVATRTLDGFTAVTRAEVTESGATTVTVAPFHTDPADPWSADPWDLAPLDGPSCLDGELPDEPVAVDELRDTQGLRDVLADD